MTSMTSGLYVVQPDYEAMEAAATDQRYGSKPGEFNISYPNTTIIWQLYQSEYPPGQLLFVVLSSF